MMIRPIRNGLFIVEDLVMVSWSVSVVDDNLQHVQLCIS